MKKLVLLGCAMIFVCCVAKKSTVATEGLEEVVVFGEEQPSVSEQPVVPTEVPALPPVAEAVTPPPISEEPVTLPPIQLPEAPVVEAPVLPPPVVEAPVLPPPVVETPVLPPVVEEAPVLPPVVEAPALPPVPEVVTPPAIVEEPVGIPPVTEIAVAPPVLPPAVPTYTPAPAPSVAPSAVYGFRVQIFASSTQKNASRVADDARSSFGGKVYVEHVAPYYKVRVGDCLTKGEADMLKNKALSIGFRGAFVVETMISP
jgi:hypothetical protein